MEAKLDELEYLISQLIALRAIATKVEGGEMLVYLIEITLVEANDELERRRTNENPRRRKGY